MIFKKNLLLTPGPTPVPPSVAAEGARPLIHHRTAQFQEIIGDVAQGLKNLFCTEHPVYFAPASGTGMMEAAVANLMSPGETMIVAEAGKFGERWTKIGKAYGCNVVTIKAPYGSVVSPEEIETVLKQTPKVKAVFTQLSETSTGAVLDIEAIGKVVAKTSALFVVDGISGVGAEPCYPDRWGIDCLLTGSQKGLMLPPGLGFISLSPKAWEACEKSTSPRFYFDLRAYKKSLEQTDTPYTPAISLLYQLKEALRLIQEETVEKMWRRHAWLAEATRSAMKALHLELFAARPGNVLTAVKVPAGVDGGKLVKEMRDQLGVTIAGGQGEMKGKVFRIAHLGYMDRFDILTGINALEIALKRQNFSLQLGAGVAAALAVLWKDPA